MIKKKFDIAFVGMSHLGLSSAIAATKYFDNILCVDEMKKNRSNKKI